MFGVVEAMVSTSYLRIQELMDYILSVTLIQK